MRPFAAALLITLLPAVSFAAERFVVIVSGASGGEKYAVLQHTWTEELVAALAKRFAVPDANIVVLDEERQWTSQATAENVQRVLKDLRGRVTADDTVLMVLFGHGTVDGNDAKFNLVGRDLTALEWKALLEPVPGKLIVVNTTESSFPFIGELSRKGRVVITATDSTAQRFATVFPEYFVRALRDGASDLDKDGRLSVFEAFSAASNAVKVHYEQRGQLSTERPLLDDDGDGIGREAGAPGGDGATARAVFLDADRQTASGDAALVALLRDRDRLQREIEDLKSRKRLVTEEQYNAELEKLLIELARVSALIRMRS